MIGRTRRFGGNFGIHIRAGLRDDWPVIFFEVQLGQGRRVTLRPEEAGDEPLLLQLYASTREEELALTGWDERTRALFVQSQFQAQRAAYRSMFPTGDFAILLLEAAPAGRIVVHQTPDEIRLVDLVIAPASRNCGLGSALLHALISEATRQNKPARLHVMQNNRAARLYQRLGFRTIALHGLHDEMEWRAPAMQP